MTQTPPIHFDTHGLVPVIVQDHLTGEIRMLAHANAEAVRATLTSGRATFWSRSRSELWEKGATSGNTVFVRDVLVDCDNDGLVYSGQPEGPSCHTGAASCFFQSLDDEGIAHRRDVPQSLLARLEATLEARKSADAGASYTRSLYDAGTEGIGRKILEEAGELVAALAGETTERVAAEAADVIYHLMVGLRARGVPLRSVLGVLAERTKVSGHEEKAGRSSR